MAAQVCALVLAGPAVAEPLDIYAKPQRLVALPDGRKINIHCLGEGAPTVLLEAGWSDSTLAWRRVQPLIARQTRVCAYDRAGLGFSDPSSAPRDTLHIVEDLEAVAKAADLSAPYVVVGYSMGGLSARLFADRNRSRMAGLVLVEPSVEHQSERFRAALPERLQRPEQAPEPTDLPVSVVEAVRAQKASAAYQHTILAELVGMQGAGSAQVAASKRPYGALPLIVLTGADNTGEDDFSPAEAERFKALWRGLHAEVAALSSVGEQRDVPGATHLIILENPEAVADAVDEVINASRTALVGPR